MYVWTPAVCAIQIFLFPTIFAAARAPAQVALRVRRAIDVAHEPVRLHRSCKAPTSSVMDVARRWTLPYQGRQRLNLLHFEAGVTVLGALALATMLWRKKQLLQGSSGS